MTVTGALSELRFSFPWNQNLPSQKRILVCRAWIPKNPPGPPRTLLAPQSNLTLWRQWDPDLAGQRQATAPGRGAQATGPEVPCIWLKQRVQSSKGALLGVHLIKVIN